MMAALNESDGLAITMLAVLALSFSCVLGIIVMVVRRAKAASCEVQELIDEVADEEREPEKAGTTAEDAPSEPWERKEDWWKG